jgi:5'-methylthioadenosine phosphorylase
MAHTIACITGEEVYRQWDAQRMEGEKIGRRETPFGASGEIFSVRRGGQEFYLLASHRGGLEKTAPRNVNALANMYALKDLGARGVLDWAPAGAILHDIAVGDLVVLSDIIDRTYLRRNTYFPQCPLGYLRQFPVFCETLRRAAGEVLHGMNLSYHGSGVAAVTEGPRLETPAEVRMLGNLGAEIITHTCVPEVFLAKELQMCFAAVCYVVNYAETGSRHRPFVAGDLFGGLTRRSDLARLAQVNRALPRIVAGVAEAVGEGPPPCECEQTMAAFIEKYKLPDDWRTWIAPS